ncbi:MAG: hypothetical protein ACR2HJ_05510 [Fimbriimonadales bacterium]
MTVALWLLAALGVIGAFDTAYYHEWKARLPARGATAAPELKLHAARDFFYAILFGSLPWIAWQGAWVIALIAVIVIEIVLTLWDFVVEIAARKTLGDVYAGERVTHAVMGIVYGAMVANLIPVLTDWWSAPSGVFMRPAPVPEWLPWGLTVMAVGVFVSGLRDLYAALGLPHGGWPWTNVDRQADA